MIFSLDDAGSGSAVERVVKGPGRHQIGGAMAGIAEEDARSERCTLASSPFVCCSLSVYIQSCADCTVRPLPLS